jgi:antirestriction protein ArdC
MKRIVFVINVIKINKMDCLQDITITEKEALSLGILNGLGFITSEKSVFKKVNAEILEQLKKGNIIFRKPWRDGYKLKGVVYGAHNYVTTHTYKGANAFMIGVSNFIHQTDYKQFLTLKQIRERGGKLNKNAEAYPVWAFIKSEKTKTNKKTGKEETTVRKGVIGYVVYPLEHTINVKPIKRKELQTSENEVNLDADILIKNMPKLPPIKHGGNQAYYTPSNDFVQMPIQKAFNSTNDYYSTLFHELSHSTGHPKRIGRDLTGRKGNAKYALEELIAELSSAYLCSVCDMPYYTLHNSTAYLKSWADVLHNEIKTNPQFLMRAIYGATKSAKYIIGTTLEKHGIINTEGKKEKTKKVKSTQTKQKTTQQKITETNATITPNKSVKASVTQAINDLLTLPQYKAIGAMAMGMFYNKFKHANVDDSIEINEGLESKLFDKLGAKHFVEYSESYDTEATLTEEGKELITSRVETLKGKKSGSNLFPELSGITDTLFIFLNAVLGFDNQIVSRENLVHLINTLHKAVKINPIDSKHPLKDIVNSTQHKLIGIINKLKPKEKIKLVVSHKKEIETKILGLQGLGFWNVIASAIIGKTAEHFTHKHLTKNNTAPTLNGVGGFVRADNRETVKVPGTYKLNGELGKFLGDIQPYKYSIVLTGDTHAGKTEVVMQLANAFADVGKTVGAFMLEQGGLESKDTQGAIDRNMTKQNLPKIFITGEASKGIESVKEYANQFNVIIIDSWQKLKIPSTKFDDLRHEYPNTVFIIIFQQNGEGGTRGGVSADFDTPVALKVHKVDATFVNNYVEMKKNRGNSQTLSLKYMVKAKKTMSI